MKTDDVTEQVEDTRDKEADSAHDLRQRLSECVKERSEVLFRLRNVVDLVLGPLDGTADVLNHLLPVSRVYVVS